MMIFQVTPGSCLIFSMTSIPEGNSIGSTCKVASSVSTVAQEKILTYTAGTDTAIVVTINGKRLLTGLWYQCNCYRCCMTATHKTTIEARGGINGVIVTNPTGAQIKVVSRYKGQSFTFTAVVTGSGSFAASGAVAAVKAGGLGTDRADNTLESMIDGALPEMFEFPLVFMVTRSMWRNLVHTIKGKTGDLPLTMMLNGVNVPTYEGYPVIIRPDWDTWIAGYQNSIQPHRAILTTQKNLIFATDGLMDPGRCGDLVQS